ncbi:pectinesterase inhibitor 6 [Aristolochia californica]|uniref:pectinesterase inhibitor 6 n=1 Tax=Aristolochia californica TaxID=171875 RepID=UPI0035E12903
MVRVMSTSYLALVLLLAAAVNHASCRPSNADDNVRRACSVTRYRDLCIHSLSSFSGSAKRSPYRWARASVSVTLSEAKNVGRYLSRLRRNGGAKGRAKLALLDCIECFQEAVDELHRSLGEMRTLEKKTFEIQMGNVETWISAALTYGETCIDGFGGSEGRLASSLLHRVENFTHFTSNALALVNKLASAGP